MSKNKKIIALLSVNILQRWDIEDHFLMSIQEFSRKIIFLFLNQNMSADLTKGSFKHFSVFCVIKILKRLNFPRFCMILQ